MDLVDNVNISMRSIGEQIREQMIDFYRKFFQI